MAKKINAVLGLAIIAAFLTHIIYEIYAYLTFYYNPVVTKVIAYTVAGLVAMHVIVTIIMIRSGHDRGKGLRYPGLNIRTIIQRASGVLMILILHLHIKNFDILSGTAGTPWFTVMQAVQVLFYGTVMLHIAASAGNALITLGVITSEKARRRSDIAVWIACAVLFIAASYVIIRTQTAMFSGGGAS